MTTEYIIKKRNKENSEFTVQKKLSKRWLWLKCMFEEFNLREWEILALMKANRTFYTYNAEDNSYTKVIKRGYHIQSKPNKTTSDNIGKLPLF